MKKIPIRNKFLMLCYSLDLVNLLSVDNFKLDDDDENIYEILVRIFLFYIAQLLKKGVTSDYVDTTNELPLVKGKINTSRTINIRTKQKVDFSLEYDEYTSNIELNQILKSTLILLLKVDIDSKLKKDIRKILKYFDDIETIKLNSNLIKKQKLKRSDSKYKNILKVAEFILENVLVSNESGIEEFQKNKDIEYRLFESFVRNYYKINYVKTNKLDSATGRVFNFSVDVSADLLPSMHTDINLEKDRNILIIDTKYYRNILNGQYEAKLSSENTYQVLAYLENYWLKTKPSKVNGMLLYPEVDVKVDKTFRFYDKYSINYLTINLNQKFQFICKDLDDIYHKYFIEGEKI